MSNVTRSKNPNWTKTARNTIRNFFRLRSNLVHLSKSVIQNPKWDPKSALNTEPQFIVAPFRGRTRRCAADAIESPQVEM